MPSVNHNKMGLLLQSPPNENCVHVPNEWELNQFSDYPEFKIVFAMSVTSSFICSVINKEFTLKAPSKLWLYENTIKDFIQKMTEHEDGVRTTCALILLEEIPK